MKWFEDKIFPAILIACILGAFGFFVDFQQLKADVRHDKSLLMEVRDDVKQIKDHLIERR